MRRRGPFEAPIRVLLVESARGFTGSVRSSLNLANALREHGVDIVWVSPPNEELASEVAEHHVLDVAGPKRSIKGALRWLTHAGVDGYRLARLARRVRADVVHVNDFYNTSGIAARPYLGRTPLVYHVRLMPDSYLGPIYRPLTALVSGAARLVVCPSHAVRRGLPSWGAETRVIPDAMSVPPVARRYAREASLVRVLVLGHFTPGKRQDLAIDAFTRAYRVDPRLRLRLVGGDLGVEKAREYLAMLQKKVAELGLTEVVQFAPARTDVAEEYTNADIVLNMSASESFSMVCLEALMFGVALVATDCGGPRELFVNGVSGVLVPNGDAEQAAQALVALARDPERLEKLGAMGRAWAKDHFDVDKIAVLWRDLYSTLARADVAHAAGATPTRS